MIESLFESQVSLILLAAAVMYVAGAVFLMMWQRRSHDVYLRFRELNLMFESRAKERRRSSRRPS